MKQAVFLILNEYADWEGAYLSSQLNQSPTWEVKTASTELEVTSIGGFKTIIDYTIQDIPPETDLLVLIGGNSWSIDNNDLKTIIGRLQI